MKRAFRYAPAAGLALILAAPALSVEAGSVRVEGNRLLRNGQAFVPRGMSMVGLLSPTQTGTAGTAGQHYGQAELDAAKAWGSNAMRFQVSQRGFDPADSLYSAAYIQRVRDGVALARSSGFVVILSMQDQSLSGGDATPMPEPQTLRSWSELTKYFNNDLEVLYELWNEPMVKDTAAEWVLWQSGGTLNGQTVVGHQQLLNNVRSTGAQNVLIAEGTRVGKSFIGCPGLTDPLNQLAYGIHPYLNSPIKDPASWDTYFGNWARAYPVVCTEWGANSGSPFAQPEWPILSPQLLTYLKAHGIGVMAWSFDILDTLIKDWNWTPTSFNGYTVGVKGCGPGEVVKQCFQQYDAGLPAAPSNLRSSATSTSQIDLAWTDAATNETGFKIERKTGSGGTWAQIATTGANVTSYSNTGLSASTTYYYRMRATNASGDSAYSNEASATTATPAPAVPTGLAATAVSSSQINLSWTDNAGNETGFKIERKAGSAGTWAQVATPGANVTSWSNTGLSASTTYFFRVRATNASGDSAYSNEASATTATPAPAAPSGLAATAVSTSQINLAWTDNAGNETGYKVERKTGSAGTYAQVATTGANVTSWSNTGLAASTTYYFRVRANNAGGDSGYSNEASATTQAPPPPPPPTGSGIGLRGEYFDNADFTTATLVRTDATVNFDWGSGSPDAALAVDSFSARWSGAVQPQYSETYTFFTTTDDGVRLWVDGKLLIDKWVDQSPTEASGTVALTAGKKYDIRMDYYENGGGAVAKLAWSSVSRAKEIIPQAQLYPWSGRDIGSVGVAGSDTVSGTGFTVKGSGADIWNTADAFHYVYQVLTGDGEIKARVASVESTDPWAKAGVMVRESLNADARHAMAVMTPGYGFAFQRRTAVAGTSATTGVGGIAAPYWVRMVRQGNNFSAYRSPDGNAWTWVGTETIGEGSPAYVGLAVTSHNNTVGCTSQIDNVTTATSVAPAGALVTVTYVSTSKPYSLATAKVGALPFIDRTYTITALPSALNGGVLVRTANDDKGVTNSSHLTLRLGQAATVYVVYDKTGTLPGWLGGWTLRGDTVTTTDAGPSPMRVYQKSVAAGDLMLGGNLQSPASGSLDDYFVVVQGAVGKAEPAGTAEALMASSVFVEGPIPADRWQHEGDSDGDGLRDDFEPSYALDPAKPDTDGDGIPDEDVRDSDGRTLWEVQEGVNLGAASDGGGAACGDGGGTGSKCGSFGLDLMAPLGLLWLLRRRRGATHRC